MANGRPRLARSRIRARAEAGLRGGTRAAVASGERLGYLPALDALRGVAIALVVSMHLFGLPVGGGLGVDLFFVLSGFLITRLLLGELGPAAVRVSLRSFYSRRARRLVPALAVLLAGYLGLAFARGDDGLAAVVRFGFYGANGYEAFVLPDPLLGAGPSATGLEHLWSLAQEEQFYLVWPVVLLVVARRRRAVASVAALLLAMVAYRAALFAHGSGHQRLYVGPDTHADGLVVGALLAMLRQRLPIRPGALVVGSAAIVAFVCVAARPSTALWDAFGLVWFEAAAVILVAAAVTQTPFAAALGGCRPLVSLGRVSYSLYLWHMVVFWAFGFAHPLATIAVSLAAAYASTRWIEAPFRRRRRADGGAPSAAPAVAPA